MILLLLLLLLLSSLDTARPQGGAQFGTSAAQSRFFRTLGFDDVEMTQQSSPQWPWHALPTRYRGFRFWRRNSEVTGYVDERLPLMNVSGTRSIADVWQYYRNKARSWPNVIFTTGEKLLVGRGGKDRSFSLYAFYASSVFLEEMFIKVEGYQKAFSQHEPLYSVTTRITSSGPGLVQLDWRGIDRLVIQCAEPSVRERCSHVAYDDFVFYR